MINYLEQYAQAQRAVVAAIPLAEVQQLIAKFHQALREDRQIFVFGNGGSGTNASHFVTDLGKSASDKMFRRFRCLSLNENISWITAIGNDYRYEDVFKRQLENYARPGDLVMVLSVSGNSPNLVTAFEWCRDAGVATVALVGRKRGRLAALADQVIVIDSEHYGQVEDAQMNICHMICYAFIENASLQEEGWQQP